MLAESGRGIAATRYRIICARSHRFGVRIWPAFGFTPLYHAHNSRDRGEARTTSPAMRDTPHHSFTFSEVLYGNDR
ncbi:MAG: hypothetical protein DMD30_11135 [Gemmatimonadetes bacterium]|nr:MAG: hypothetical protein DMD30_11135 [Gemmatimonadota bacterium]